MTRPRLDDQYPAPRHLNLGCGRYLQPHHIGIDASEAAVASHAEGRCIHHDLNEGIPFGNDSVASLYSAHFLEHLDTDQVDRFIGDMWRVCEDGAPIHLILPYGMSHHAMKPEHKSAFTEDFFTPWQREIFGEKLHVQRFVYTYEGVDEQGHDLFTQADQLAFRKFFAYHEAIGTMLRKNFVNIVRQFHIELKVSK